MDGFRVPNGTIPKGFQGEKGVVLRPWEVRALLAAQRCSHAHQDLEGQFPTQFAFLRPMNPQPDNPPGYFNDGGYFMMNKGGMHVGGSHVGGAYPKDQWKWSRRQRLWVKETWQLVEWYKDWETGVIDDYGIAEFTDREACVGGPRGSNYDLSSVLYRQDDNEFSEDEDFAWRPSTTMPRWASRIDLVVLDAHAIKLQNIDGNIVKKTWIGHDFMNVHGDYENPHPPFFEEPKEDVHYYDHREAYEDFKSEWDAYYGKKDLGWDENPWVYVVSCRIVHESEYLMHEIRRLQSELRRAGAHKPREKQPLTTFS